ncbi:MAG: hypothetical protein AMXMBFR48_18790, partial [Ignavibacteriales bacterium]
MRTRLSRQKQKTRKRQHRPPVRKFCFPVNLNLTWLENHPELVKKLEKHFPWFSDQWIRLQAAKFLLEINKQAAKDHSPPEAVVQAAEGAPLVFSSLQNSLYRFRYGIALLMILLSAPQISYAGQSGSAAHTGREPLPGTEALLTRNTGENGYIYAAERPEQDTIYTGDKTDGDNPLEQEYTLTGTVRSLERNTSVKLENVRVDVDSSSFIAKTDTSGRFIIDGIPAGTHHIRVSKQGFLTMNDKSYTIHENKTFNISIIDTVQHVPLGDWRINLAQLYEQYNGLDIVQPNPYLWMHDSIPAFFSGLRSADSLKVFKAIGKMNGNWTESDSGSVEWLLQRPVYKLTTDSAHAWNNGLMLIRGPPNSTNYMVLSNEYGGYMAAAICSVGNFDSGVIQHEAAGFAFDKSYVFSYLSNMNTNASGKPYTLIDNAVTWIVFNHRDAMYRGEADMPLYAMEEFVNPVVPQQSSISFPANNAVNVPLDTVFRWLNTIGADAYQLQVDDDSLFNSPLVDSLINKTKTPVTLDDGVTYFARVRSINDAGLSSWSPVSRFTTLTIPPSMPTLVSPQNNATNIPINPLLEWLSTSGASRYVVQVDDDILFNSPSVNDTIVDTIKNVSLNPHTVYHWRVQALNNGGTSQFNTQSFTTINNPPTTFRYLNPLGDTVHTHTPVHWTKSTDPDNDPILYIHRLSGGGRDTTVQTTDTTFIIPETWLKPETAYTIDGKVTDGRDTTQSTNKAQFRTGTTVDVTEAEIPEEYRLYQNYPNPFNPVTVIEFTLAGRTEVTLKVYDVFGREIAVLVSGSYSAGSYTIAFDGISHASGVYLYSLITEQQTLTR